MENKYKVITVTGLDLCGKETQTRLLQKVLEPSVRISAPDYTHWTGQIIRSVLTEQPFYIADGENSGQWTEQTKHPQILQLLHSINTWDKQEMIRETLKTSHLINDRYIEDVYAYGYVDGCSLEFLFELNRDFIQSDVVIVLLGKGYPRNGETPDSNERNTSFQDRVRKAYESLATFFPNWKVMNVDAYRSFDNYEAIHHIHRGICWYAHQITGEEIFSLNVEEVRSYVNQWEKQRVDALKSQIEAVS